MKTFYLFLLAFALVAGPAALMGCETETQTEIESDGDTDVDTELTFDDEVEADLNELGDDIEAGAEDLGNDIQDAAQDAADTIDENIDLGDNAGTPEADDNN